MDLQQTIESQEFVELPFCKYCEDFTYIQVENEARTACCDELIQTQKTPIDWVRVIPKRIT